MVGSVRVVASKKQWRRSSTVNCHRVRMHADQKFCVNPNCCDDFRPYKLLLSNRSLQTEQIKCTIKIFNQQDDLKKCKNYCLHPLNSSAAVCFSVCVSPPSCLYLQYFCSASQATPLSAVHCLSRKKSPDSRTSS